LAVVAAAALPAAALAEPAPRIVAGPVVSGTPAVGATLTATAGWVPAGRPGAWQWLRCRGNDVNACTVIPGAGTATYVVAPADTGRRLRAWVTVVSSDGDRGVYGYSVATAPVPGTPATVVAPAPTPSSQPASPPVVTPPVAPPGSSRRHRSRRLRPRAIVRIRGRLTANGARVTLLTVHVPASARVTIRCRGASCPYSLWWRRVGSTRLVRARPFERRLPAGTRLAVTVTEHGFVGKRTVIVIRRGRAPARTDRCLYPGSARPRACSAP
jgi:hypothetical protein